MGSWYEVEVTITSATQLKNVNWRNGKLNPYAVVWLDPLTKCSTHVDASGDTSPYWDAKLLIPFNSPIDGSSLYVDIVHANAADGTKPLVGSARLSIRSVIDDVGLGGIAERALELKRPSGRPQGNLEIKLSVREPRCRVPKPYYPPSYTVPHAAPYVNPYGAPPVYAAPPSLYPTFGAPATYGQPSYQQHVYAMEENRKRGFGGMGTGLAVGAVVGTLGGLALAEGFDAMENKIADAVAERVLEDDLSYGGDE